jgi:hypothetical protein
MALTCEEIGDRVIRDNADRDRQAGSRITNVLLHKTTIDRLDSLPPFPPSPYRAPDTDPA